MWRVFGLFFGYIEALASRPEGAILDGVQSKGGWPQPKMITTDYIEIVFLEVSERQRGVRNMGRGLPHIPPH
jgi:hypothetical protein